jgi:hypothetical protein
VGATVSARPVHLEALTLTYRYRDRELAHFRIEVLDVVDVVVSKLKRFHANDLRDIEAMVDRDLVPHTVCDNLECSPALIGALIWLSF